MWSRWAPSTILRVPVRERKREIAQTHRKGRADWGDAAPQAGRQEPARSWKEEGQSLLWRALVGFTSASRTVRDEMPVVLGHLVTGNLSQKSQGTHTTSRSGTPQEGRTKTPQSCHITVWPEARCCFSFSLSHETQGWENHPHGCVGVRPGHM